LLGKIDDFLRIAFFLESLSELHPVTLGEARQSGV